MKLTKEERISLHLAMHFIASEPLNTIKVSADGLVTSTKDEFEPTRVDPLSPLPEAQFLAIGFEAIHKVAFGGVDRVQCVQDLVALGVRRELVEYVEYIMRNYFGHNRLSSLVINSVTSLYDSEVDAPTTVLGDTHGK